MASEYTSNNAIEKIGTGEQAGTWGSTTNTNFDIIDRAINGVGAITLSGTTHTLTTSDGTVSDGHFKVLVFGGSPSGTNTVTIDPNNQDKLYFIKNNTSQSIIIKQGTGDTVTIAATKTAIVYADGAGSGAAVAQIETGSDSFTEDLTVKTSDGALLTLQTSDTTITDGDVLGALQFQAPNEGDGSDGALVSASISGEADATFSATVNSTDLVFKLGTDGAVAEKMRLTHEGDLNLVTDDKKINFGADSDINITHVADTGLTTNGDFSVGDDLKLTSDGAVLGFGADNEVTVTHVHDTGLRFEDSDKLLFGAGSDLQIFHDGTDSKITNSTGHFKLLGDSIALNNAAEGANLALFTAGDAAKLYFNGGEKLATTTSGVSVTGTLSAGEVTATSDERLKSDIQTIDNALDKVMNMRGVSYTKQAEKGVGVIAQEIEKVLPEVVTDGEYKAVAYGNIVGVLIEAIKEQQKQIDELKKDN